MRESAAVCLYEVKVGFVSATINSSNVSTLDSYCKVLGWFQFYCEVLAYSDVLMYTTITVILFNVLAMAIDRDYFDDFWSAFLTVFQLLTTSDIGVKHL